MKEFLLFFSIMGIARTDPNCMVLKAFNYFGSPTWYTNPSACFTHLMDSVNNLTIYYTNQSIIGLAFNFNNGTNESYIHYNSSLIGEESINLSNSFIIGVDVWIGAGINGLQFKLSENKNTSIMGSSNGCNSFLNSTNVNSKYFKIDSIIGCIDDKISTDFSSIGFHYSFSQCPFIASSSATKWSVATVTETIVTTSTILWISISSSTFTTEAMNSLVTSTSTQEPTTTLTITRECRNVSITNQNQSMSVKENFCFNESKKIHLSSLC